MLGLHVFFRKPHHVDVGMESEALKGVLTSTPPRIVFVEEKGDASGIPRRSERSMPPEPSKATIRARRHI
jgi:hypothetical protein